MIKKLLLIGFLCCASLGWGQIVHAAGWETQNVFTNTNQFLLGLTVGPVVTANLGTLSSLTTLVYVSDGKPGSNPCVGGGPGALAVQIGGIWTCGNGGGYSPAGSLQLQVSSANGAAFTAPIPNAVPGSNLVSTGSTPAFQTKPVLDARDFGTPNGSNAGTLIQAAHDSAQCASTGCVIDARGFGATDTIAGLSVTKPVEIDFGATNFSLTNTITVTGTTAPILRGAGRNSTIFTWAGGSAQMIRLVSVQNPIIERMALVAKSATPATAMVTSERGATGNPTGNVFRDLFIQCTDGGCADAFSWPVGAGGDAGNDHSQFDDVIAANYTNACYNNSFSTQAQYFSFKDSVCESDTYGKYGYYGKGSAEFFNQQMSLNTVTDYQITESNNGIQIIGGGSIGSNRLYEDPCTSGFFQVTILGVNFAATNLNADGKVIIACGAGPYNIANNSINAVTSSVPVQFYYGGYGFSSLYASANNVLGSSFGCNYLQPAGEWYGIANNYGDTPTGPCPDTFPFNLLVGGALQIGATDTGISRDPILGASTRDYGNGTPGSIAGTDQFANVNIKQTLTLNAAPTLVASGIAQYTGPTTLALNTTNSTLLVAQLNGYKSNAAISDTAANSWTYLTGYNDGTNYIRYAYVCGPTTSTFDQFNYSGGTSGTTGPSMIVWAFSGTATSACEDTASGTSSAVNSPLQPGSIAVLANDLVFTGCTTTPPVTPPTGEITAASVNDSFSPATIANGYANEQAMGAYLTGASAGALNPTITITGPSACVPAIAAFKASTTTPATMTLGAGGTITMTGAPSDSYVKADGTGYGTPSSVTLVGQTGTLASSCDNHVASGTGTLQQYGSSPEAVYNVAFSDGANFCDANYSIHVFRTSAPCGFGNGTLYGQNKTAFGFTVVSTDTTELTCTFDWSTAGYQ